MKKFINIMLALALTVGVATITVAQDAPKKEDTKKTTKKGKAKKSADTKDTTKAPKAKSKAKKAKDDKADTK